MIQGLTTRITKGNVPVARLHYSADPNKRPGTEKGDAWLDQATSGYPGGVASNRWRKEMEIDYGALGGQKVFPNLELWIARGKIVVPHLNAIGYKLYGSYDHGWRHPSAYYVHGIDTEGKITTLWEFYGSHVTVNDVSRIIKGEDVITSEGDRYAGNPYAGQEIVKVADPQIWTEDQMLSDNTMKSVAHLFEQNKIYFEPGNHGGDTTVIEWILGHFWRDPDNPLWQITTDCPKLIWELGKLRHKELSARVALNRDQPEALVDKDNHGWDSIKMFFQKFPPTPGELKASQAPGTFAWWKKQAKVAAEGGIPSTYHRECAR